LSYTRVGPAMVTRQLTGVNRAFENRARPRFVR
jgi:hypothetical protein